MGRTDPVTDRVTGMDQINPYSYYLLKLNRKVSRSVPPGVLVNIADPVPWDLTWNECAEA